MDWTAIVELGLAALSAGAIALAFYVKSTTQSQIDRAIAAQNDAGKGLRDTVIDHDRRIIVIEGSLKALPSKDDVHLISLDIAKLVGEMRAMNVRMDDLGVSSKANGSKLDRLEQHIYQREAERP